VYCFACKNAHARDAQMVSWTIEDLKMNFKSYAQPIPAILESTPSHELIWSDISDIEPLTQFAFGKLVLIGDAGHATTPNLGQGACMGMEDALAIADELSRDTSIEESFKRFEQKRIKRTTYIVNTSYQLGKIAQLENKILVQLRNFVLRMTPSWVNERQVAKVLDV
jgi:2-polyprenyl-6-methoxyphenol hydroxylase-like FAD-dependent oxidoreductase